MSTTQSTEHGSALAQAVDEEYEKLTRFYLDRGRTVLIDANYRREGGVRYRSTSRAVSLRLSPRSAGSTVICPPQLVAVKQIRESNFATMTRVKRAFSREMLVWSSSEAHPGITKFLGFYAEFEHSKAWLLSP
ncbi:hypothetical protein M407DRAFT_23104 [Tulasnella calospora MUT 4182]|uniref:Protein kinase domain-containing protein n=1 Tax=Tulasnella calospora MUT 4182 TaxID=1051891 RepID=A0A0C3QB69_9AGAM|nr:hypothetical protein M407DRAFT_23104 [Tulasnella calospora MUT 4182]